MKDFKIYLIIASILLALYLTAQFNRPKATDWTVTLQSTDKMPFGTYILHNLIGDIFPGANFLSFREPAYNVVTDHHLKNSTYIVIANRVNLNEYDYDKVVQFVKAGSDVLISASDFGSTLKKKLKIETGYESSKNDAIRLGFTSKSVSINKYAVDHDCTNGYFTSFDSVKFIVLGQNEFQHSNFIKIGMGRGSLYLNASPLMFSNYSLLQDQGAVYVPAVLSYLHISKNLIWDDYYSQGRKENSSSFRVFLANPLLRNALYISFSALLLYVLYQMKRRQRIIPIIEPLHNTTLDFVNVVGQVYYEQRDNRNIAQKKAAYFLEHLRTKYNLKTTVLNEEFGEALAHKSGVETTLIKDLLIQVSSMRSGAKVSDQDLIQLNKNIEQFYLQSR